MSDQAAHSEKVRKEREALKTVQRIEDAASTQIGPLGVLDI